MNISCKFIRYIRDFYFRAKFGYYNIIEIAKEIKENLKNPQVRKIAPFVLLFLLQ